MIAENKDLHETDKLFKKLVAPSLGSLHLDSHVHQHHTIVKMSPVLLPQRSSSRGTPQASRTVAQSLRTPPSTEIALDDSFPGIVGQATNSALHNEESFAHSYQSGIGIRRQQPRAGTSLSSESSTTKMRQLPLPQVQSSEVLRTSSPSPRGKKNVSVCSDRYLGTSRMAQPHRRSKSAADILHPMSSNASSSDQVRRFEDERIALLQTRTLKRTSELMAHRKDRKYHMCGAGVPLHDRYMVDSEEMDRLRQLIQARTTKTRSSPISYYGRYGVRVSSGRGSTRQTKISSASEEQKDLRGNNIDSSRVTVETNENQNNVAIATPDKNEENVVVAAPPADIGKETDVQDGSLVVGEDKKKDEDDKLVEVATDSTDARRSTCQEGEELNETDLMNDELDAPVESQPVSSDKGQDVELPVEGAITPTKDDAKESPDLESELDDAHPGDTDGNDSTAEEMMAEVSGEDKDWDNPGGVGDEADKDSGSSGEFDIRQIQNMMPNVKISTTQKRKNGKDAFMTEFEIADLAKDDIQDMLGNFKSEQPATQKGNGSSIEGAGEGTNYDESAQGMSGEPKPLTAEEALMGMIVSDDRITAMEEGLRRIDRLKGGIQDVGHLEESQLDLEELNAEKPDVDYGQEVFGRVLNDEELKEIERLRAEKREATERSAKAGKADDSIMVTEKVSQAKSKMADMYSFISLQQQEVFEKKFTELDIDGNGIITLPELFKRMYRGKANKEMGRAFMQVFDLNKDQTIDEREFVIVAALNDKLTGKLTESADAPLELDLDRLAQNITAYKEIFQVTDQDADGRLTLEDVMLVISLSGNPESGIDPEVVQHVHNTIDADDNGTIDFMEYLTYIPFFLKLHKRMAQSRHITIAEVERARESVRSAILKVRGNKDVTLTSF